MKSLFPAFLFLAAVAATPSASALELAFNVDDPAIHVGESFSVEVVALDLFSNPPVVVNGENFIGFGLNLAVDPTLFRLDGFTLDAAFLDLGSSVDGDAGTGFLTGITLAPFGIPNAPNFDQPLFVIQLSALNLQGVSPFSLEGEASGPLATEGLFFGVTSVSVEPTGTELEAVPEPGALSLLSLGLAGLWLGRRKRRPAEAPRA